MSNLWVVAYDISDNTVRRKVRDVLGNYGSRVQYSVFECFVTRRELEAARSQVKALLQEDDQVRWYPLCSWCAERVSWQGLGSKGRDEGFSIL